MKLKKEVGDLVYEMTKEPSSTTNLVLFKYFWLSISPHFSLFILGPHPLLPTDRYHWALVHKLPKLGLYEMTVLPLTKKSTLKQYKSIPTVTCLPCKTILPIEAVSIFSKLSSFSIISCRQTRTKSRNYPYIGVGDSVFGSEGQG